MVWLNAQQNTRTEATTNDEGFFSIPTLRAGAYTIEISAPNFSTQSRPDFVLEVAQVARLDVQLQAGNVTETIEVSGGVHHYDLAYTLPD